MKSYKRRTTKRYSKKRNAKSYSKKRNTKRYSKKLQKGGSTFPCVFSGLRDGPYTASTKDTSTKKINISALFSIYSFFHMVQPEILSQRGRSGFSDLRETREYVLEHVGRIGYAQQQASRHQPRCANTWPLKCGNVWDDGGCDFPKLGGRNGMGWYKHVGYGFNQILSSEKETLHNERTPNDYICPNCQSELDKYGIHGQFTDERTALDNRLNSALWAHFNAIDNDAHYMIKALMENTIHLFWRQLMLIEFQQIPLPMEQGDTELGESFKAYFTMWLKRKLYTTLSADRTYSDCTNDSTCIYKTDSAYPRGDWGIRVLGSKAAWDSVKSSIDQRYWVISNNMMELIINGEFPRHDTRNPPSREDVDLHKRTLFDMISKNVMDKLNIIYETYLMIPGDSQYIDSVDGVDILGVGGGGDEVTVYDILSMCSQKWLELPTRTQAAVKNCHLQVYSLKLMETPIRNHHSKIFAIVDRPGQSIEERWSALKRYHEHLSPSQTWIDKIKHTTYELLHVHGLIRYYQDNDSEHLRTAADSDPATSCFDTVMQDDYNIQEYLAENENNFVIKLPRSDKYECMSIDNLKSQWRLTLEDIDKYTEDPTKGKPYYKKWYACREKNNLPHSHQIVEGNHLGHKIQVNNVIRYEADNQTEIPESSYIKIGSANWLVQKPDWIYDGTPPEPRIFSLVEVKNLHTITANDMMDGVPDPLSDVFLSSDHCNTEPMLSYKLVPIR
jgi:hypothetical protein